MSKSPIPVALGRSVAREGRYRCGYCRSLEAIGVSMVFDHIIPTSRGGRTLRNNLWLACFRCNSSKSDRVRAFDPLTKKEVRLFNPRRDDWFTHFRWMDGGLRSEGITAARRLWISAGWHPPRDKLTPTSSPSPPSRRGVGPASFDAFPSSCGGRLLGCPWSGSFKDGIQVITGT